jgi:hypothetical protein
MSVRLQTLTLAALCSLLLAPPALAGPPWISIETPVNPYDPTMRDAFLLVHAFHHGMAVDLSVAGHAEGIVDGQRRTVTLVFTPTSRDGVYALRRSWPREGKWVLVITAGQGPEGGATAIVRLAESGEVASVSVPTERRGEWTVPRAVSEAEVVALLK